MDDVTERTRLSRVGRARGEGQERWCDHFVHLDKAPLVSFTFWYRSRGEWLAPATDRLGGRSALTPPGSACSQRSSNGKASSRVRATQSHVVRSRPVVRVADYRSATQLPRRASPAATHSPPRSCVRPRRPRRPRPPCAGPPPPPPRPQPARPTPNPTPSTTPATTPVTGTGTGTGTAPRSREAPAGSTPPTSGWSRSCAPSRRRSSAGRESWSAKGRSSRG